jgi:hypothetical protein
MSGIFFMEIFQEHHPAFSYIFFSAMQKRIASLGQAMA